MNPLRSCCTEASFEMKVIDDNTNMLHKGRLCYCAPFSPCPCLLCCGFGPCGAGLKSKRDEADPAKWVGYGSVFKGGCCDSCFHHNGDIIYFDEEHDGTEDRPLEAQAGKNPFAPPCWWGKKAITLRKMASARTGAPGAEAMSR